MNNATVYALSVAALAAAAIAIAGCAITTSDPAPASVVEQAEAAAVQVAAQPSPMSIPF